MSKTCKKTACAKKTSIGGQALIEGIMMRGPKKTAMAVRNPEGEIVLEQWETKSVTKAKITKLPIIRGVFGFINSMVFGYKCLMRSAEIAGLEDAIAEDEKKAPAKQEPKENTTQQIQAEVAETVEEPPASEAISDETNGEEVPMTETVPEQKVDATEKKESSALMTGVMIVATVLGVALAVGLFIMLPTFLYGLLERWLPFLSPDNAALDSLLKSVFEGILKIAILVVYMLLVSRMKEIKRTFQYHGAEHKTIFCYEHEKELTVENVRNERRFHPRCGTSFLILMLLVGIFVGFFIDPLFILIGGVELLEAGWVYTAIRAAVKLLLLPLTMGLGYELIKLAGRHDNLFTRIISAPGMWLQHLTVLEPTDDMIECAITAFREVIPEDESDRY
ncbi:MAG: DUF1385 domain-containing protein [Ruminococcaceae bacterium]|nr:DUF1385 domain-containing protein [Oscillospiraceae bacterium]